MSLALSPALSLSKGCRIAKGEPGGEPVEPLVETG